MADPDTELGKTPSDRHIFACVNCGADMRFAPGQDKVVCDHCGHSEPVAPGPRAPAIRELDLQDGLRAALSDQDIEDTRVLHCPNCGAQFDLPPHTHAAECPFCATPVVTDTGAHRQIKPRAVLPFQLDEEVARRAMTDWLGQLWFAPNGLMNYARKGRRMQGVYVPYWTFDADTRSRYSGERGDDYYTTRTAMRDGQRVQVRERHTRWRPARGQVARFFDDVLVLASRALPKRFTDALAPWDLADLEPYRPEFLAGFTAEAYTVDIDDGFDEARAHMDRIIARDVRFNIGGDHQRIHSIDTQLSDVTFKHVLLPVWLAAYKYRGKTYRFVVNGQTGRVRGERPWSTVKIAIAVLLVAAIAAIAGYFYALEQGAV